MGRKPIDMSGKKLGRLTVIEYAGNEMWRCRCDCGNEILRRGSNLRKSKHQSCGCWGAEISRENGRTNKIDLIGKRIGKLRVLRKIDGNEKTEVFECLCDCGNHVNVKRRYLLDGSKTHCGCESQIKDMVGCIFGRLTVIEFAGMSQKNTAQWLCKCECGNTKVVDGYLLRSGGTISCGCYHAERTREAKKKYNEFFVENGVVNVKLSNSDKTMLCDIDDWERLKQNCWMLGGNGYACTNMEGVKGVGMYFHRQIIQCDAGMVRDHINRNRLDNRKCNLRIVSAKENALNQGLRKNNTSGYRGVHYSKRYNKYVAQITNNGENHYLGRFDNIEDAIEARLKGEMKYFGKIVSDME